jgi:parallel beta-helix repeat protein
MKREKLAAVFFAVVIVLGLAASAGAVDGTIEINQATVLAAGGFPYNINNPGSYRLTGNLTATAGFDGIDIAANYVTLDLNGFSIVGTAAGTSSVGVGSINPGTTVENGTVTGFSFGLHLVDNNIVKSVHADSNSSGIYVGNNSVIESCTANLNSVAGIVCSGSGCAISGNTVNGKASSKSFHGIEVTGSIGLILHNIVSNNSSSGIVATDPTTGYGENILNNNGAPPISGGTSMGNNVCSGVLC